jgi:ribosome biogenesis GTPase
MVANSKSKGIEGENEGEIWRCHLRSNLEALVTGDEVMWQADSIRIKLVLSPH